MVCRGTVAAAASFLIVVSIYNEVAAAESLLGPGMLRTAPSPAELAEAEAAAVDSATAGSSAVEVQQAMDPVFAAILEAHNTYRATHGAQPLTWSAEVAASATKWANACKWGHPTMADNGQNLAAYAPGQYPAQSLLRAVTEWYNEVKDWDFTTSASKNDNPVLHFTQVVWRRTRYLGCAVTYCTNLVRLSDGRAAFPSGLTTGDYVVCEYAPAGNYDGDFPSNVLPAGSSMDPGGGDGDPGAPSPVPVDPGQPTTPVPSGNNFLIEGSFLRSGGACLISAKNNYKMCLNSRGRLTTQRGTEVTWRTKAQGQARRGPYTLLFVGQPKPSSVVVQDKNSNQLTSVVTFTRTVTGNNNRPVALVLGDDGALYVWEKGNCLKKYVGTQSTC